LRNVNARYLRSLIREIPGIIPYKLYPNVTRAAYHLFPFRYNKDEFKGLSRAKFLEALRAEGVPCSGGYTELNKMPFLENAFQTKYFLKFYPKEQLNYERYAAENACPLNEKICNEAVWITQNVLLGTRSDMENIAAAIRKIRENAEQISKK
jgi:dTDP-4-amino-4,6-dideoxygalactose transaminase